MARSRRSRSSGFGSFGDMAGGLGDAARLGGGLGKRDRLDIGRLPSPGVFPTKGKGWGVIGESTYPDLLNYDIQHVRFQSWKLGMDLSATPMVGMAERYQALNVVTTDPFRTDGILRQVPTLVAGFSSGTSPEKRWTVAIRLRGQFISYRSLEGVQQQHELRLNPVTGLVQPVLILTFPRNRVNELGNSGGLVGELVEDAGTGPRSLEADPTASKGLFLIETNVSQRQMVFDASCFYQRVYKSDGRLVLRRVDIGPMDTPPSFRSWMHLDTGTALSCNCPAFIGAEYTALWPASPMGSQALYPQQGSGDQLVRDEKESLLREEGVTRRFQDLPVNRLPEDGCKHCHAVRFSLGVAFEEPPNLVNLTSDYWNSRRAFDAFEGFTSPLDSPRFLEQLERQLMDERALSKTDGTLIASSIGDAFVVLPTDLPLPSMPEPAAFTVSPAAARFPMQHFTTNVNQDRPIMAGDWWVGRGTTPLSEIACYVTSSSAITRPAFSPMTEVPNMPSNVP